MAVVAVCRPSARACWSNDGSTGDPPARRNRRRASGARRARLAQPVGEEADARQRRDREHQCKDEQRHSPARQSRAVMRAAWRNRSRRPKRPACAFTSWPGCRPAAAPRVAALQSRFPDRVEPRHHVVRHPAKAARDTAPQARECRGRRDEGGKQHEERERNEEREHGPPTTRPSSVDDAIQFEIGSGDRLIIARVPAFATCAAPASEPPAACDREHGRIGMAERRPRARRRPECG